MSPLLSTLRTPPKSIPNEPWETVALRPPSQCAESVRSPASTVRARHTSGRHWVRVLTALFHGQAIPQEGRLERRHAEPTQVTNLSKQQAEDLLDWLGATGHADYALSHVEGAGFTVRYI